MLLPPDRIAGFKVWMGDFLSLENRKLPFKSMIIVMQCVGAMSPSIWWVGGGIMVHSCSWYLRKSLVFYFLFWFLYVWYIIYLHCCWNPLFSTHMLWATAADSVMDAQWLRSVFFLVVGTMEVVMRVVLLPPFSCCTVRKTGCFVALDQVCGASSFCLAFHIFLVST